MRSIMLSQGGLRPGPGLLVAREIRLVLFPDPSGDMKSIPGQLAQNYCVILLAL